MYLFLGGAPEKPQQGAKEGEAAPAAAQGQAASSSSRPKKE